MSLSVCREVTERARTHGGRTAGLLLQRPFSAERRRMKTLLLLLSADDGHVLLREALLDPTLTGRVVNT